MGNPTDDGKLAAIAALCRHTSDGGSATEMLPADQGPAREILAVPVADIHRILDAADALAPDAEWPAVRVVFDELHVDTDTGPSLLVAKLTARATRTWIRAQERMERP